MRKKKEPEIDPDSMIGQVITTMVGAIVGLTLLDEMIQQMHSMRLFRTKEYVLFSPRM